MPPVIIFLRPFKLAFAAALCGALVNPSAGAQPDAPTSAYTPKPSAAAHPRPNTAASAHVPSSGSRQSLPLRAASGGTGAASQSPMFRDGGQSHSRSIASIWTVVSGLAIVLGLFFLVAWLFKRGMPKAATALPREVVETLGRVTLAPRQTVHLIRIGQKLLLVSISATGVETLTEITDPLEVDRLAGICNRSAPSSASSAFRHVFQQFSHEPARAGFVGDGDQSNKELASRELVPEVTDA